MPYKAPTFRPARKKRLPESRPSPSARGYDARWVAFRSATISSNPERWLRCTACRKYVSDPSQIHIDHITPLAQGGAKYDPDNLQPLCKWCHGRKTRAEDQA